MSETSAHQDDDVEITLPGATPVGVGDDELDQIRSLLFGEQARRTLERVERVENEVLSALSELRADMDARFAEMDSRMSAEVEARTSATSSLATRLDEESAARRDAQIDLRTDSERQASKIRQTLKTATKELSERIEEVDTDLRGSTVNRQSLAGLLEHVANDLSS